MIVGLCKSMLDDCEPRKLCFSWSGGQEMITLGDYEGQKHLPYVIAEGQGIWPSVIVGVKENQT